VQVTPVPEWLKTARMTRALTWEQLEALSGHPQFAFCVDYEAQTLGDPDPTWTGPRPISHQDVVLEVVIYANLTAWLAPPSALGFTWLGTQRCGRLRRLHPSGCSLQMRQNELE